MKEKEPTIPRHVEGLPDHVNEYFYEVNRMLNNGWATGTTPENIEKEKKLLEESGFEVVIKELPDPNNRTERALKPVMFIRKKKK